MKVIDGGVTCPKGFSAASAEANIKYKDRKDMALVYSEIPAVVSGVFTTNVVKAAPVKWDIDIIKNNEKAQAIVLNSGIANAFTGKIGEEVNEIMAKSIADNFDIPINYVLTASTGVIGVQIPKECIINGAKLLKESISNNIEAGTSAAEAIMTTDTVLKQCAVQVEIDGKVVTIGGMAKGSGMIHPNMATMLSVITSDISISKKLLQELVSEDVKDTFNMISVDRDTSTNDTLVVFANGMAENKEITEKNDNYEIFKKAYNFVTKTLAKNMASDGEGATKLIEVTVINANTKEEARILSKSVITSNLVKTAIFGNDANLGRILCALGYSGVIFNPDKIEIYMESKTGKIKVVENGLIIWQNEEEATKILSDKEVKVIVDIKQGKEEATAWGCDLTYDYVKINGDYRS